MLDVVPVRRVKQILRPSGDTNLDEAPAIVYITT